MIALWLIVPLALLFWVGSVKTMQWAERRFPAFSRWLDRTVGDEPEWLKPY